MLTAEVIMIRTLIADNQQLFRDLLEYTLKDSNEIEVAGSVENGIEAVKAAMEYLPDVVILDQAIPAGIYAVKKIKENGLETKILVLTESREIKDVTTALDSGADGYLLKRVGKEELIVAIKAVHYDMGIIDKSIRKIAYKSLSLTRKSGRDRNLIRINGIEVKLSDRELRIIEMIVEGMSNSDMARELFITEGRLRNIITELISKLMLKDRTQLAVFAIRSGLVQ